MITLSYLKLHPELEANGELSTVRFAGYPWLGWLTLAGLLGLTALMLFDPSARGQIVSVVAIVTVLLLLSLLTRGKAAEVTQR